MSNNISIELLESQNRLEFALQSGKMGTWEIDLKTDTVICSKEMLLLWNVPENELNGSRKILQSKVHPDDLNIMRDAIQKAIDTDSIYELEYRIHPEPGKTLWVLSRGRCAYIPGTKTPDRFSGIVYDISERKIKEEQLADLARSRDQFFMIASHELKTPLTLLILQHQVLESELHEKFPEAFESEKIQDILKKQNENLQRISRIIDNILDESQINHGRLNFHFEEVDLSVTLMDIIQRFKVSPNVSGIDLMAKIENNITGTWDKFRLEQVILNLLSNAVRYGKGSPITVKLQKHHESALLSVRDEGPGIKTDDHKRIFSRFERVNEDHSIQGIGLGLFICDQIVSAHRGKIHVQSAPEQGAEFIVSLPL